MADNTVTKPDPLEIDEENTAELWNIWKDEFGWYMDAIGVAEGENTKRIGYLLQTVGKDAREVFRQFEFGAGESAKVFKDVIAKFDEYCAPRNNVVYECFNFIRKRQEEGETFNAFMVDLKKRAATCDLGDQRDKWIMLMVIVGIRDAKLQDKWLKEDDLTLKKVIRMGRLSESAAHQLKEMHPTETTTIAAVGAKNKSRGTRPPQPQPQRRQDGEQARRQDGDRGNEYDCRRCATRHKARSCPAFKTKCDNCSYRGHYTKCCTVQVRVVQSWDDPSKDDYDDGDYEFIGTINMVHQNEQGEMTTSSTMDKVDQSMNTGGTSKCDLKALCDMFDEQEGCGDNTLVHSSENVNTQSIAASGEPPELSPAQCVTRQSPDLASLCDLYDKQEENTPRRQRPSKKKRSRIVLSTKLVDLGDKYDVVKSPSRTPEVDGSSGKPEVATETVNKHVNATDVNKAVVNNKPDVDSMSDVNTETVNKAIRHVKINYAERWTHPLSIQDAIVVVKLDTGAAANIITMSDFNALSIKPKLRETNVRLTDYNYNEIVAVGACILEVKVWDRKHHLKFIVVKSGPSLIGYQACERLGLVKRVFQLEQSLQHRETQAADDVKDIRQCTLPEVKDKLSSIPFTHEIKLQKDYVPVINAPRRIPVALRDKLRAELSRMQDLGVIESVSEPTEWVNSIVVVGKPDGKLRVCLDPKDLNKCIMRELYQLPTREDIFANMSGATHFSKLDASQAFWQVKLSEKSRSLTTFNTPFGRYRYCRLPYGLCSAPEVFHRTMETMMEGLAGTRVYMDDIIVWGTTTEEHDIRLNCVKERIAKYGLLMNWEKCDIRKKQITFIGEVLSADGIRPNPDRITAILQMVRPNNREAVQRALGSINYVGKFVANLSARIKHLRSLLCKEIEWSWGHEHEKEWQDIKSILSSKPVLSFFNPRLPTKISTDASSNGLGAVLLQEYKEGWKPVSYGARGMTESECRYAQIEKECLGIVFGCQKFHQYIFGLPNIILETDHKPLIPLSKKALSDMTPRLQRLMLKLQRYSFTLIWTPGKHLYLADALSRSNAATSTKLSTTVNAHVNMVMGALASKDSLHERIRKATVTDDVLQAVIRCVMEGWRGGQCMAYVNFRDELSVVDGLLLKGMRLVIPVSMRGEMLAAVHTGHLGAEKQKRMARECMYWPNMNRDIDNMVQSCATCLKYRPAQPKESLLRTDDRQTGPWERVCMDLFQWNNKMYLIVVDSYSNYPEIAMLGSTSSKAVIQHIKSIFARHGIPRIVCSDNGPQFSAATFKIFADSYGFKHETSSPKYPKANGQAEKAVGIVKQLLSRAGEKGEDPYLALLAYRKAPREMGRSPAELLMGRRLRSNLPQLDDEHRIPEHVVKDRRSREQAANEKYYNQGAKDLSELHHGDVVRLKDKRWDKRAIVNKLVAPRSYQIELEDGSVLRRNRRDLMTVKEPFNRDPSDIVLYDDHEISPNDYKGEDDLEHNKSVVISSDVPETIIPVTPPAIRPSDSRGLRRSGRARKPVQRLDL